MQKHFKKILVLLFLFAFLIRLSGISYGLPLWLINDEPSTVLGALKMMELKSVIPALHAKEMATVLYYPPYISYLYIVPFSIVAGFQLMIAGLSMPTILSDLSPYFIVARFLSILVGMFSIWLVYETSQSLFSSRKAALISAFLTATSLIHISLSLSARHWIFISLIYSLAFYFLIKKKSYSYFSTTAAIGMGVSTISIFLFAFLPLWYFIFEKGKLASLKNLLINRRSLLTICACAALIVLPTLLYPMSNGFIVDVTATSSKNILGILISPFQFLGLLLGTEPVLIISALFGFVVLYRKNKRLFFSLAGFIYIYSIIYYVLFRYESRFLLPILPLIYIVGGYALHLLHKKRYILPLLMIPLCASLMLSYLSLHNDSRIHAIKWVQKNISGEKILTYGSQFRIPTNKKAITEQRTIDTSSIRKIDTAEEEIDAIANPHVLNTYTIKDEKFWSTATDYSKKNGYTVFVIEHSDSDIGKMANDLPVQQSLASFGNNTLYSIATSEFRGNLLSFFKLKTLGPKINIFR